MKTESLNLTISQAAALDYIEDYARKLCSEEQKELASVLTMSNIDRKTFEAAIEQIREKARIALHFHPDRVSASGKIVAESLLEDGLYKNQFETLLSNGKLDPIQEGVRAQWEDNFFGQAFTKHKARLSERPKYGALNLMLHPDGPAPRFGSCYILLKPFSSHKSSFSYMDSHQDPLEKGTIKVFEPIISALMLECFERRFALGKHNFSPSDLINHLLTNLKQPFKNLAKQQPGRNLNHYIEAQVQGDISLVRDAEFLVADPCFKGCLVEEIFEHLCHKYQLQLFWHTGFRLAVDKTPDNFRGPTIPSLAKRVSTSDYLDARMIGNAAADLKKNPEKWADRGPYNVVLQELKCLWHVLVQFGEPV